MEPHRAGWSPHRWSSWTPHVRFERTRRPVPPPPLSQGVFSSYPYTSCVLPEDQLPADRYTQLPCQGVILSKVNGLRRLSSLRGTKIVKNPDKSERAAGP